MSTSPVTLTIETSDQASAVFRKFAPRLVLRAHPVTLAGLSDLAAGLPIAGTPAASVAPILGVAVDLLAGGWAIEPDEELPAGAWTLTADGRHLASGTVTL